MTRTQYENYFDEATKIADTMLGMTMREVKLSKEFDRAERNELRRQHSKLFEAYWNANFPAIPTGWLYATAEH